jgi:hypothetical protein
VAEGVDKTLQSELLISDDLQALGLSNGKYEIARQDTGSDNRLELYLIFAEDFDDTLIVKAFDKNDQEIGRSTQTVSGTKDEAKYFDFDFDKRTVIESKSKLFVELKK